MINISLTARATARHALLLLALAVCFAAPRATTARADDDDPDAAADASCHCAEGRACYHYLRAPLRPPEGSCFCPACDPDHPHAGDKCPKGWNPLCFATRNMDCFLKRHAASWGAICSACAADVKCCKTPHPENCPQCDDADAQPFGRDAAERAAAQVAIESKVFDKRPPIVIWTRRSYVVTDIAKIKINTQGGPPRWADQHEYAHILLERAERAQIDFRRGIGAPRVGRPVGIFAPESDSVGRKLKESYFRNARVHMMYGAFGGSAESNIAGGFCLNGLCVTLQTAFGKDRTLHQAIRHNLGHILISNWVKTQGENRTLPRWMYAGVGHWLGKLPPELRDEVFYCEGEERKATGSGKDWWKDLTARATTHGFGPIQELLVKDGLGQLTYDDHQRAWGWFQMALEEWKRPFLALLADLRREREVRGAFQERLGMSPEEFEARFESRLTGKLTSLDPEASKGAAIDVAELPHADLETETDPARLAPAIRTFGPPVDAAGVARLLTLFSRVDSDLVRETIYQMLLRMETEPARTALVEDGLTRPDPLVRAYCARVCRKKALRAAQSALRAASNDANWLVRAEALLASAAIGDKDSQLRMFTLLDDPVAKTRIAAMDALAMFGRDGVIDPIVPGIASNLTHRAWQVRVATCQALAVVGDHRAVEPLIERMELEGGRVREEAQAALREVTGDDLGKKPENWRAWWEKERARVKERGGLDRPKAPRTGGAYAPGTPDHDYGHFGIELFSERVGYVIDTSQSTFRKFEFDPQLTSRLTGAYPDATVIDLFRGEVLESLARLDPRSRISLVSFGSRVSRWKPGTTPLSGTSRASAESFVANCRPDGETNFHGALIEALDMAGKPRYGAEFEDTADTLVFLTDGSPTVGEVTDADTLLDWYTELDRYARIRTHVVVYGSLGVDEDLLEALAARNRGRFVQVRELRAK